jgi:hypothetical protein
MVLQDLFWLIILAVGFLRTRTRTQWNGTRTRREYWDVVDIQSRIRGSSFLKIEIELNRFERFEYEHEYEYRCAEYEKTVLRPKNTPGDPKAFIRSKAKALGMQILINCIEFVFKIIEELNYFAVASAIPCCQIRR